MPYTLAYMCIKDITPKRHNNLCCAQHPNVPVINLFYRRGIFQMNQHNSSPKLYLVNNQNRERSRDSDLLFCIDLKAVSYCILKTSIVLKYRKLTGITLAFVTHKHNALLGSFWLGRFPNHSLIAKGILNNNLKSFQPLQLE